MERKLWGFFSSNQVVAIITVITLAIAVPSGVWAVSFTYNVLYNPTNGQMGYIDGSRRLWVTDSYLEQSQIPANFYHSSQIFLPNTGCVTLAAPPSGKALIVRQVGLNIDTNPSPGTFQSVFLYKGALCGQLITVLNPPTIGNFNIPFDPGFATREGVSISIYGTQLGTSAYVEGYLVPAAQAPANPAFASLAHSRPVQNQQTRSAGKGP